MILRKPYAFFIKIFRPVHFVFVFCLGFMISKQSNILSFLSNYLYTDKYFDTTNAAEKLISNYLYIIPIFLIISSLIMFGIMFRKGKPYKFYVISFFILLVILIINFYTANFLKVFESTTVAIKSVKLIHDLVLMCILAESFLIIIYIGRGLGVNFKNFDFSSDIAKFDIEENDKEEFELDINFDLNEAKRKRKNRIRKVKYFYLENKFLINLGIAVVFAIIVFIIIISLIKKNKYNVENVEYNLNGFNMIVEKTNILNTNYEGNRITENYLVVVNVKLNSYYSAKTLFMKDFRLKIGEAIIYPTKKYGKYLTDLGKIYDNENLTSDYGSFIFVYEIPKKFIASEMNLSYNDTGYNFDIRLNPKNLVYGKEEKKLKIGETIDFKDGLGDISFNIKNYEINDYYKIDYNYCLNNDNCINSIEYLKPNIDENFDKTILKLEVEYENNTELNLSNFYNLLNEFGDIYYLKNGEWEIQSDYFEQIFSKKGSNYYSYIGIDKSIKDAESIKLVFKIRGIEYEYVLK